MILEDYSQVAISNLHQQLKQSKRNSGLSLGGVVIGDDDEPGVVEPDMLRHMILNSIRKHNREFSQKYGRMVICTDNHNYWRKGYFKYYKAHRKKDREDSGIDWNLVFQVLNELRNELRTYFPYKVMDVSMAEADDVIGVVAKKFHEQEKILIISGDKDFMQLQAYPGVEQYSPVRGEFLRTSDPGRFLLEHIIRGDKGDGVPNFLSDDAVFVTGGRQKPIYDTKVDVWLNQQPEEFCDERLLKNYTRNKKLVDLTQIPEAVEAAILEEFGKPIIGSKNKIFGYMVKHRMKNLLDLIRDF